MVFKEGDPKNELYPYIRDYTSFLKKMERPLVGREKEMDSLLAAMARPELCNAILLAEAGSGKALADDTLIPVADERGYVPICEIKVGDKVFDENGEPVTVSGVFPQGLKHAFLFRQVDGAEVVCNDEHLWNARTRNQHYTGSEYKTLSLQEMMIQGFRAPINGVDNVKQWYIPVNKPVQREAIDYGVHPYVMGILISDGCLSSLQMTGPLRVSIPDRAVAERMAMLIGADGTEPVPGRKQSWQFYHQKQGSKEVEYIQAKDMFDLCYADSVFGQGRAGKTIPYEYLIGSVEQRMELLRGLMDCDGTISGNDRLNCSFHTSNEQLGYDVIELLSSLGMRATFTVNDRTDGIHFNPEYRVHISVPDEAKEGLFWLERHKKKFRKHRRLDKKFTRHFDDIAVDEVIDLQQDVSMTCIYVDSESHLFLATERHIVTHNTALVQGTMLKDTARAYLEVDLPKMISNLKNENEMADKLKQLFKEVEEFRKVEGREIVLFIDEFHQIVQLSSAAVEVLKPLLADSGTRGIHVIAATTYIEFQDYIASNLPLVERLQRINLAPPGKQVVIQILRTMAERYGVENQFPTDSMFEAIYDYTNRYIPSSAQPRKSILMLDSMIGWHRYSKKPINMRMLADVIYETQGVNIAFRVDASQIKKRLDERVLSQDFATSAIASRLQICVADLNNKDKPMSSFLFTGSTGTGKSYVSKEMARILFENDRSLIRMDMTEYALPESLERFRDELTTAVWTRPYSVVLLDEIEKADGAITRLLLQVLDDGRLIDRNNREVSFKNAYIIITTNAGSEIYKTISQYQVDDTGSGKLLQKYEALIRESIRTTTGGNKFPPELLGRIDCIVPFQPLSEHTMGLICQTRLNELREKVMRIHNVRINWDNRIVKYLVQDKMTTDADAGGARGVISRIEKEVTVEVARFINENPHLRNGRQIWVGVEGVLAVEDKNRKDSAGRVYVRDKPPNM